MDAKQPPADALKIEDLAERSGVSVRTIRYYLQRGLLPPPIFRGRETIYAQSTVERLKAIRQLQARMLPLEAIASLLEPLPSSSIALVAEGVLTIDPTGRLTLQDPAHPLPPLVAGHAPLASERPPRPAPAAPVPAPRADKGPDKSVRASNVTNWRRVEFAPGLELHVDAERLSAVEHVKGTSDVNRIVAALEKAARALLDPAHQ